MSAVIRRPASIRPRRERRVGQIPRLLVLLAIGLLVATCGGPSPSPTPADSPAPTAPSSVTPTSTPGVTPLPTLPPDDTGWTKLELPVLAQVASLEAMQAGPASVAPSTAFRLTSVAGGPVRQLAARLVATPALDLRIVRVAGDTAVLQPSAPLESGRVYRFELLRDDGTAEAAWAVQAAWPLQVASTIPGDAATDVPRDTGLEITFDQAGVLLTDVGTHVSFSPAIEGRFEQHGRAFAYVPTQPLAENTLYTVTVHRGLPVPGTGMTLEQDVIVRFETAGGPVPRVHVTAERQLVDAGTTERPVIALWLDDSEDEPIEVDSLVVTVHRLPGLTAAMDAYRRVVATPDWAERAGATPVSTASLPQVLSGTLKVVRQPYDDWRGWVRLPRTLPAGWYVVTLSNGGTGLQVVLQVTDLAVFSMITITRGLVWVNDLRTNAPVADARVTLEGHAFGVTNSDGLRVGSLPAALIADAGDGDTAPLAVVRSAGRSVFLPLGSNIYCWRCDQASGESWWHLLRTDRIQYRASDTVNVWGVVRDRDSGAVPASATVRLMTLGGDEVVAAAVTGTTVTPDASGAWVADLAFKDLPPDEYQVSLLVSDTPIASTWIEVRPITKPAWQIQLATPRLAVLSGDPVELTATASFFEGTPVAGAALSFYADAPDEGDDEDGSTSGNQPIATDASGRAIGTVAPRLGTDITEQQSILDIGASANNPEEADIGASLPIAVFRSTALVDANAVLKGTTLTIKGAVHDVVLGRYVGADAADLWRIDPRGAPRADVTVRIRITESIPVVRQTGSSYDPISKRVTPVYKVTRREVALPARTVRTGTNGAFRLSLTVAGGDHSYTIRAIYVDEAGRRTAEETYAHRDVVTAIDRSARILDTSTGERSGEYESGETVGVRFAGGIAHAEVSRYLFAVASRGLRRVTVQDGPRYSFRFGAGLQPSANVTAVRFNGVGYDVRIDGFEASLRLDTRQLDVSLTPDRARYAPGDRVTVDVRTTDRAGRPVAASVFVRAVDEKLFAIGAAASDDPLAELYQSPGSGVVSVDWSHVVLAGGSGKGGGGDTTGGPGSGGRQDFRDWLVAELVTTGADGRGTLSFALSDDLTSWRVLASGVTRDLKAGAGMASIVVGLPFFADAIVAPEYLTSDRPIIRVRAYGTALATAQPVTFTVSSDTLPMAPVALAGVAFQPLEIALPRLTAGTHRIRIAATTGSGARARTDVLTRTFTAVDTRTGQRHSASVVLTPGLTIDGGTGMTTVTLVDAGRGRVVPLLRELATDQPMRADSALAAAVARRLLADEFGIEDDPSLVPVDLSPFQGGEGLALLPYGSTDLELSALAALAADPALDLHRLRAYFQDQEPDRPTDEGPLVLLGRAALGEATIDDVATFAARTDLSPDQQVTVALAAVAIGDLALARRLERDLLARYGQRLGPWVRLNLPTSERTAVATARLAIVAAALGDPLAADLDAEVAAHPPVDTLVSVERALAARYWVHVTPRSQAAAAVTLDGTRRTVTLSDGVPVVFQVAPAQRAGLRIDPVSGSIVVLSEWDGPLDSGELSVPAGLSITRSLAPSGTIAATDTVVVTFSVTLPEAPDQGCWQVTDEAPSGLVPIARRHDWYDDDEDEDDGPDVLYPVRVVGQRVDFCVTRDPDRTTQELRYVARVVTSGSYRWESAVIQSTIVPDQGMVIPAFAVTIRGEEG